jgi:acyl carrier protein
MDVNKFICEICGLDEPLKDDEELIESGILDSLAIIELISALEEEDIIIHLTRIDRNMLRTVSSINRLIEETREKESL